MKQNDVLSVLIAEDEPIILNNIVKKIKKSSSNIQIAGKAQSGKEALEILATCQVDILFTDIEMPGMSGLELIRHVKTDFPQVHIVILSAYSNFEYARTALRYGVEDYLLKPVEQTVLTELLHTLCNQIQQEKNQNSREILSLALHDSSKLDTPPYMFRYGGFYLIHIMIGNLPFSFDESESLLNKTFYNIWSQVDFEKCFRNTTELGHLWVIDDHSPLQKFLVLHLEDFHQSVDYFLTLLKKYFSDCLMEMPYLILAYNNIIPYQELWNKANLLRSAVKPHARPFTQASHIITDSDSFPSYDTSELLKDMNLLFTLNSETQFLQSIHRTLPDTFLYPQKVLYQCIQIIYNAMEVVFQINNAECTCASTAFFSRIPSMRSADTMFKCLEESLRELWENASTPITRSTLCARLAQYIELNFSQQISLTDLSEKFGYTASYINRIFKKEYGVSPLQYLTGLKISRSKEILEKNPEMNIKSVAQSVGYDDARYFSRIFKNETGMTPSAWIEKSP